MSKLMWMVVGGVIVVLAAVGLGVGLGVDWDSVNGTATIEEVQVHIEENLTAHVTSDNEDKVKATINGDIDYYDDYYDYEIIEVKDASLSSVDTTIVSTYTRDIDDIFVSTFTETYDPSIDWLTYNATMTVELDNREESRHIIDVELRVL